jgi:hypothetical protein
MKETKGKIFCINIKTLELNLNVKLLKSPVGVPIKYNINTK